MNKEALQQFIQEKANRQLILKDRLAVLQTLDDELSSSKIGRWFGNVYLFTKRYVILFLSIILILGAILFFFFPQIIFKDDVLKTEIINQYKSNFSEKQGSSLDLQFKEISTNYSADKVKNLEIHLDESIGNSIENQIKNKLQFIAFLVLLLGIILLYIARLTRKIQLRNAKLAEAEKITAAVINDYALTITEEEKELNLLKTLIKENL